jgi:hypothetical protein
VRHRARGDREIEHHEQIGEPEAPADRRRVVNRLFDRLEIVGLLGDLRKGSRRGFAAVPRRTPVRRGWIEPLDGSPPQGSTLSASAEAVRFTTNRARNQTRTKP